MSFCTAETSQLPQVQHRTAVPYGSVDCVLYGLAKASAEHVGGLFFDGRVPAAPGLTIGAYFMAGSIWTVRFASGEELKNQSTSDLRALVRAGRLTPDDLVWRKGLADWVKARKLRGLFSDQAAPNTPTPKPASSSPPASTANASGNPQSNSSSLVLVNLLIGLAIICPASAILMAITKMHFVLGAFAGVCVLALVGAAAFALLFKPERVPAGIRGAARWCVGLLIGVGLAGLFGLMTAIAAPGVAKQHAEDATHRAELLAQAESAYAEGRLEDALELADDALHYGSAFDDDPSREDARRLTNQIRRELEPESTSTEAIQAAQSVDSHPDGMGISLEEFRNRFPLLAQYNPVVDETATPHHYKWAFDEDSVPLQRGVHMYARFVRVIGPEDNVTNVRASVALPRDVVNSDELQESMAFLTAVIAHTSGAGSRQPSAVVLELQDAVMAEARRSGLRQAVLSIDGYEVKMQVTGAEHESVWLMDVSVRKE